MRAKLTRTMSDDLFNAFSLTLCVYKVCGLLDLRTSLCVQAAGAGRPGGRAEDAAKIKELEPPYCAHRPVYPEAGAVTASFVPAAAPTYC